MLLNSYPGPRQDEIITPHQTTLLKLVDSYLQANHLNATRDAKVYAMYDKLSPTMAEIFLKFSSHAQTAITKSLGPASAPAELDVMLPKVCEALVLITQCIITLVLVTEETHAPVKMRGIFNSIQSEYSTGLVESLIGMIRCFTSVVCSRLQDYCDSWINFCLVSTLGNRRPVVQHPQAATQPASPILNGI